MVRVLHLLPAAADYQTEMAVAQLSRDGASAIASEIRTIGAGGDHASAIACIIALRRHGASAELIHAWGEPALFAAAVGGNQRIIYSPTEFPRRTAVRWLRSIMDYRQVQVICPTDTMRRAFVEHGVPIERCHLIRPGVDFSRVNRRRDPALRAALGFAEADFVMLALGESTRAAEHSRTAWAAVLLHVLDPRNRLLLWGKGELAAREARFIQCLGQPNLCGIATERLSSAITFEQLLPATDLAIVTASRPVSTLPIAVCMAAALPIVAVVSSTASELLEDRHNAMLVGTNSPRAIAQRVLDIRDDPHLRWAICDMARTEAYEYFSQTRFVQQIREVYHQLDTGERVQLSPAAPGAGARFHGVS
jgi:glycosyltransferase involved in cell wall biosynthesis